MRNHVMKIPMPVIFSPKTATQPTAGCDTSVRSGDSHSSEPKPIPSLGMLPDLPRPPRPTGTPPAIHTGSSRRNSIIGTTEAEGTESSQPPQQPPHAYGTYESHGAWNNKEIQEWADVKKKMPKMADLDDLKHVLQSVKDLTDGKAEKVQGQAILHIVKNDLSGHLEGMTPAQLETMLGAMKDLPQKHINLFINKLQLHFRQKYKDSGRASFSETQNFMKKTMQILGPRAMAALSPNRNDAYELAWQLSN